MTISKQIIVALLASVLSLSVSADNKENKQADTSLKEERNLIRKGNKLFESKRYGEAEVEYKKALQVNPMSEIGNYNLAAALLQQGGLHISSGFQSMRILQSKDKCFRIIFINIY